MYTQVVVPLDGSERAETALPTAAALVRNGGAMLELVGVVHDGVAQAAQADYLSKIAADIEAPQVTTRVLIGNHPGEHIAALQQHRPEVIVCMATHGRTGLAQTAFGSVAAEVVRRGHGPVVLVGPHADSHGIAGFDRLVTCLDGSKLSETILPTVTSWAVGLSLELDLVEVLARDVREQMRAAHIPSTDIREDAYLARTSSDLQREGLAVTWEVLHDDHPGKAIVGFASARDGCLIAMATHGRGGLARLVAGSVAASVVHTAHCPVLLLRPEEFT